VRFAARTVDTLWSVQPITDDDAIIELALADVSIPALMCSMVHLTGDPSWIRGDIKPAGIYLNEYQGFMDDATKAEGRRRALAAIAAFRDSGAPLPPAPSIEVLHEMMSYLACAAVPAEVVPMFVEDLRLDGDTPPRPIAKPGRVVVIGCGESGLLAGIRLQQAGVPFTIIEKNAGPGGTWWENRYPGARVDVGSHFYCYSFEPADHWTEYFSQQPELAAYFSNVMTKYGIDEHCRFNAEVTAATWNERTATWSVAVRGEDGVTETLEAEVIISAVGSLNRPKLPDIEGIDTFDGPSFHAARWDHSVDYRGKKVALVGAGASGFQIAPAIAADVAELTVFQRTAQWMFPNPNYHRAVPDGDKWAMRHLPFYDRWFRFLTFWPAAGLSLENSRRDPNFDDSDGLAINERNKATREIFLSLMAAQVDDDADLLAKITPDYPVTGKRTLQDNGSWLRCLTRDNVELVRSPITRVVANGVEAADGTVYEADIICYATGFRSNDYLWPMTITGRAGLVLNEVWGNEPSAYLGIAVPNFPNLFCLYGPGTNLAHGGSLIYQSECQMNFIIDALRLLFDGGHRTIEPTQAAHDDYTSRYRSEIDQMVWAHWAVKHSHYKNDEGRIHTISPWPIPTYWQWTKQFDRDAFIVR
jgi:4-hydroxyacetophenone monooxygenase